MKKITMSLAVLAAFASAVPAQQAAKKTAPKKVAAKVKPAQKAPAPVTIPADAKEISPGYYRWVDPKGQAWTYRKTPFGIMRGPEQKAAAPAPVPTDWTATDAGDSVAFTGPSPFGQKHWTAKKTELNETEAAVWKRAQEAHNTASASTGK